MAGTAPTSRLQKLQTDSATSRLPRTTSGQLLDEYGHQRPVPIAPTSGSLSSPNLAAEHGVFLSPSPIGSTVHTSRPSSPDYSVSRPSTANNSDGRPVTPTTPIIRVQGGQAPLTPPASAKDEKKNKRKSWFGRTKSTDVLDKGPAAWVIGHTEKIPFDTNELQRGHPVSSSCSSWATAPMLTLP